MLPSWNTLATILTCTLALRCAPCGYAHVLSESLKHKAFDGEYSYRLQMPWRSANIEFNSDGRFQVITTPHWVLHWYNDSGVTNPAALYLQITTSIDGSNLFVLRHPNPQNGKRMGLVPEATVYPWLVPSPRDIHSYVLWLAFIAPILFTNEMGHILSPNCGDLVLHANGQCEVPYRWSFPPSEGALAELSIFSPSELPIRDFRNRGIIRHVKLPQPYDRGYLLAQAKWGKPLYIGSQSIPTSYSLSYYATKQNATSSNDLTLYYTYNLRVKHVQAAVDQPAVPAGFETGKSIYVRDYRFYKYNVPMVVYGITNSWHTEQATLESPRVKHAERMDLDTYIRAELGLIRPHASGRLTYVIRLTLLTLAFLPVIAGAIVWARRRKSQTHTTLESK
jgi:hypothetical protein